MLNEKGKNMISLDNKEKYFTLLLSTVSKCDLCQRMCNRKKVLSNLNGNIYSKVIFIAEAPGRLGADCTGIPLYGDKTGENFEMLLGNIGWSRQDVFITNSILCNPQDENGNNSTPNKEEIANCSYYLEMTLELINPDVIVTLGVKALEALKIIENHDYVLRNCVAKCLDWHGRKLVPLYHMGPRAIIHRSLIQQRADFIRLSHMVNPATGLKNSKTMQKSKNNQNNMNSRIIDMIAIINREIKELSFFKLTKLLYLLDYFYYEKQGTSISGSIYLRVQEGPWIPSLKEIIKEINGKLCMTYFSKKKPYIEFIENDYKYRLSSNEIDFIKEMCSKYQKHSDAQIKTAAYLTKPMKYIIKQENMGRNMTKVPVLYKDASVIDYDKIDQKCN